MRSVLALIIVITAGLIALAGCTKTVTVTTKYRSAVGLYWICTGPSYAPCIKGSIYRVSKSEYDQARIGQSYKISIP